VSYANAFSVTGSGIFENTGSNAITTTGGINTNMSGNVVVDGGTAGLTIANVMTPTGAGASYYIKGNVTFTGHNMSSLVVRAAGEATAKFTLTNGVSSFNLWFIGSDTAANAMNIDVASGVTVNEDSGQGAASLYYKNIMGAGTLFMGGANNTTGYVLGDVTIANVVGATMAGNFNIAGTLTGLGANSTVSVGNSPGSATVGALAGTTTQNVEVQFNNIGAPVNGGTP
jgi:hypothetical protein